MSGNSSLRSLISVLHLTHKYDIPHLRYQCISALHETIPSSLKAWDDAFATRWLDPLGRPLTNVLFRLANVALQTSANTLLVPVLYLCACETMETILSGDEDGGSSVALNSSNRRKVLLARDKLSHMARTMILGQIFSPEGECRHSQCRSGKRKLARRLISGPSSDGFLPPLSDPVGKGQGLRPSGFCDACFTTLQFNIAKGRRTAWKALPEVFGVGQQN